MSKKKKSPPADEPQSGFLKYTPIIITLLTLLFGLFQYFDSQLKGDIRRFKQAYFDERLNLYKNLSSSVSEVMVDMQLQDTAGFKKSYKKFKANYWSIEIVKDDSYKNLIDAIQFFDSIAYGHYKSKLKKLDKPVKQFKQSKQDNQGRRVREPKSPEEVEKELKIIYGNALVQVQVINRELNKLILYELDKINNDNYIFGILR